MTKIKTILLGLLLSGIICVSGCKKTTTNNSILGAWAYTGFQEATRINDSLVNDSTHNVYGVTYTYLANGTYTISFPPDTQVYIGGSYDILGNRILLVDSTTVPPRAANDSIVTLNTHSLVTLNNDTMGNKTTQTIFYNSR